MISRRRAIAAGAATVFPFSAFAKGGGSCVLAPTPVEGKIVEFITGPKTPFSLSETKVVQRRSFSLWTKGEWHDLDRAYRTLAKRDAGDPTSLVWQAALHGYYMSADDIHANWYFLPWHRAFLYFHELILRNVIGPDFRLPVWDWEEHDSTEKIIPDAFRRLPNAPVAVCDSQRPKRRNAYPLTRCVAQAWLLSSNLDFLGYPSQESRASLGPHHLIHNRLGAVMSHLAVAAADPVFYAHHANIDRMWWHWSNNYSDLIKAMPSSHREEWHKRVFVFASPDGKPVTLSVADLQDIGKLGYSYQPPKVDLRGVISVAFVADFLSQLTEGKTATGHLSLAGSMKELSTFVHSMDMLPVQITIRKSELRDLKENQFYGVALKSNILGRPLLIGSFALLPGHHQDDRIFVAGCLSSEAVHQVSLNPAGLDIVWGPFSPLGDGTLMKLKSLRSAAWKVFQSAG